MQFIFKEREIERKNQLPKLLDDFSSIVINGVGGDALKLMCGKSTCIFACLQCEYPILFGIHSHYTTWKSFKMNFFLFYKIQNQHLNFTIKVAQSFCFFFYFPGVFSFDYEITNFEFGERIQSQPFPQYVRMNHVCICYLLPIQKEEEEE